MLGGLKLNNVVSVSNGCLYLKKNSSHLKYSSKDGLFKNYLKL